MEKDAMMKGQGMRPNSPRLAPYAVHPREMRGGTRREESTDSIIKDFGIYQRALLIVTQVAYFPVVASLLTSSFFKPPPELCQSGLNETSLPDGVFRSLLIEWSIACTPQSERVLTTVSTMVMLGGLSGSFASGFFADQFGRKPIVVGSLIVLSACNLFLLAANAHAWYFSLPVFVMLGASGGAYMTTNLVLVVESLSTASAKLLVVAVNGWPLAISFTAILCWLVPHWFGYHCVVAALAMLGAIILWVLADESLPWLASRHSEQRLRRAAARLERFNGKNYLPDAALERLLTIGQANPHPQETPSCASLLRNPSLRSNLLALAYCFFVSSIVSFGSYFNADAMPGNRYMNMAIMGAAKFALGLIPFVVSGFLSRKKVALISVGLATTAVWTLAACVFWDMSPNHMALTVLSLILAATLDPTWKVAHFYSTELFPTAIRNSARGLCVSVARFGSALAPLAVHLRASAPLVPFTLFGLLLSVQFLVITCILPELGEQPAPLARTPLRIEKGASLPDLLEHGDEKL